VYILPETNENKKAAREERLDDKLKVRLDGKLKVRLDGKLTVSQHIININILCRNRCKNS